MEIIEWIDNNNIKVKEDSAFYWNALKIKEWMEKNNTKKPPSKNSKESLEEKKLGQFLANIRQGLIKPYNKLETEAEKEEYRKEHPELDDVMEIIEWIDENNVKVKEDSKYYWRIIAIKEWMEENNTTRPPRCQTSSKTIPEKEGELGTQLSNIRRFLILPYIELENEEDKEAYKKAIRLCAENGITHMSNYLLYNGEEFKGKGHSYHADTPEDLYERMQISMNLQEELCERLDHKVAIFSFPMRYIPLSDLKRGFVGTNWNMKYLRALQRMLIPTQGKGVSSRSFFEADMGKSQEDFVRFLAMPEEHLGWRGDFLPKKGESTEQKKHRKEVWLENQQFIDEWNRLFFSLGDTKKDFIDLIGDNDFSIEKYDKIENPLHKRLFIHYFTHTNFLKALLLNNESGVFMAKYIREEFPLMYKRMVEYIAGGKLPYSMIAGPMKMFKEDFVKDVLGQLDFDALEEPFALNNLIKSQKALHLHIFPLELVRCLYMYNGVGLLDEDEKRKIVLSIKKLDERKTRKLLLSHFEGFKKAVIEALSADEVGADYIIKQVEEQLDDVYKQMTIWDEGI